MDETEVEEGLQRVAASTGREVEQVRQLYQERDLMGILRRQLRDEKTLKFVLDNAEIVQASEGEAAEDQEKD